MRTIEQVRKELNDKYNQLGNWRKVGKFYNLPARTVNRIARDLTYYPKRSDILLKFDLPAMALHPVCRKCGKVHPPKRCPDGRRVYQDLFAIPTKQLANMLQNRTDRF